MGTTQSQQMQYAAFDQEQNARMIPFNDLAETTVGEVIVLMHYPDEITSFTVVLRPYRVDQNVPELTRLARELQALPSSPEHRLLKVQFLHNRKFGHLNMEVPSRKPVDLDIDMFRARLDILKQVAPGVSAVNMVAATVVFHVEVRMEDEFEVLSSLFLLFMRYGVLLSADKTDVTPAHVRARATFDVLCKVYDIGYRRQYN
jgi:hypothetical protein